MSDSSLYFLIVLSTVPGTWFIYKLYLLRRERKCVHFRLQHEEKHVSAVNFTHFTCITQVTQVEGIFHLPEPVDPCLIFCRLILPHRTHKRLWDWPDCQRVQGIFGGWSLSGKVFWLQLLFWRFLPKQHKHLTGNTFTTRRSSSFVAKDEATQLGRFIAGSGFVKLGGWVSSSQCHRTVSAKSRWT